MIKTVIHPNNDAIQLIDKKINILVETIDYLSENNPKGSGSTNRELKHCVDKIINLKKSKDLLIKYSGLVEVDDVPKSRKGCTKKVKVGIVDEEGSVLKSFDSIADAERYTGISRNTIRYIINRGEHSNALYKFVVLSEI